MSDDSWNATAQSPASLIREAKRERQRLIEQIIAHSREVIARIDETLARITKE